MDARGLVTHWESTGILKTPEIRAAFLSVPREIFIPQKYHEEAYEDVPLPIGHGQAISQPTTVIMMLEALQPQHTERVLEIGTGSGYNAALLSKLAKHVISIEIEPSLAATAKERLDKLQFTNVDVIVSDGSVGYESFAPYDRIIVTAAAPRIPTELIEQLADGGIILIPVGEQYGQTMIRGTKAQGTLKTEELGQFVFVPLRGKRGQEE